MELVEAASWVCVRSDKRDKDDIEEFCSNDNIFMGFSLPCRPQKYDIFFSQSVSVGLSKEQLYVIWIDRHDEHASIHSMNR